MHEIACLLGAEQGNHSKTEWMMLATSLRCYYKLASVGCLATQQCISSYLIRRSVAALSQCQGRHLHSWDSHQSTQTRTSFVQKCGFIPSAPFLTSNLITKCEVYRFYASKKKGQKSKRSNQRVEDFSDDEDEDLTKDDSWNSDDEAEAESGPKTWKDLTINASSLRVDAILSSGLAISRKKVEDAFLDTRILLNGKKITKKSKMVNEGDVVDVILKERRQGEEDNHKSMAVMRVKVLKIKDDLTAKDRVPMKLRRWKYLETPKT